MLIVELALQPCPKRLLGILQPAASSKLWRHLRFSGRDILDGLVMAMPCFTACEGPKDLVLYRSAFIVSYVDKEPSTNDFTPWACLSDALGWKHMRLLTCAAKK